MSNLTETFDCYTGDQLACWQNPYEELLDRLAHSIGPDNARTAFKVIGAHLHATATTRMLDSLMKAYGDALIQVANSTVVEGQHNRRVLPPVG